MWCPNVVIQIPPAPALLPLRPSHHTGTHTHRPTCTCTRCSLACCSSSRTSARPFSSSPCGSEHAKACVERGRLAHVPCMRCPSSRTGPARPCALLACQGQRRVRVHRNTMCPSSSPSLLPVAVPAQPDHALLLSAAPRPGRWHGAVCEG